MTKPDQGVVDATTLVSVDPPASGPTVVHYRTVDATAVAGVDYSPASGSITIPQGDAGGRIDVFVRGNLRNEPTQSFQVQITGVDRPATVDSGGGVVTIDSVSRASERCDRCRVGRRADGSQRDRDGSVHVVDGERPRRDCFVRDPIRQRDSGFRLRERDRIDHRPARRDDRFGTGDDPRGHDVRRD